MYKFNEIEKVYVEISTACQAKCPMCARNFHGGLPNPYIKKTNIDLESFKNILTPKIIKQLKHINFCGNFGDPLLNNDLIHIVKYINQNNPFINFVMHTNGSAMPILWWEEFAKVLPKDHLIQFGIDGLEDTHYLYRIGTSFKKIIENAKIFIKNGGQARWNFITFKHNEHQLEECKILAKELGFNSFYEIQTTRFLGDPWFDVLDKNGNLSYKLEIPSNQKPVIVNKETIKNYKEIIKYACIECEAEKIKSIYIDAYKHLWPCSWLASVPYIYINPEDILYDFQKDNLESLLSKLNLFGGLSALDLSKYSIEDIIDNLNWQSIWNEGFKENTPLMCSRMCGKFNKPTIAQFKDQYINLDKF